MLFKLSMKNIKKSFKDYTIYFFTLILGVAIFYVFNSLDSQQAMDVMGTSTDDLIEMMVQMLGGMSVFVSFILGFLIVYANNFLIRRRKKEFGVYMTLGMGKNQISTILLGETFCIGILSLAAGLALGVFGAQFMSVLVVKMFNGVMDGYEFVFSSAACIKTIVYFGIMFLVVAIFNVICLSKYRLIELLSADKKNERVKMKNPWLCFLVFLVAAADLGIQYYQVTHVEVLTMQKIGFIILAGCIGTFLVFWSLSGFLLNIVQHTRKYYFRDLNAFILRQIHSKINTMVFSMTVICLMLFITICVLSGGLGMNYNLQKTLKELTPVDVNVYTSARSEGGTDMRDADEILQAEGFDMGLLKEDYVQIPVYSTPELTLKDTVGQEGSEETEKNFAFYGAEIQESILKVSDYNKIADFYGAEPLKVEENTYAVLCDYESMSAIRNQALANGTEFEIDGTVFSPAYEECQYGFLQMMANHANVGIIVLPDDQVKEEWRDYSFLAANYQADTREEKEKIDEQIMQYSARNGDAGLLINTQIDIRAVNGGMSAIVTFIAIYLGIIFLISGAAILALKELSDSSDSRSRYEVLRKIGVDEKMIARALFHQTAIFFFVPLILAMIHSVFGMMFINLILTSMSMEANFTSILATAGIFLIVYGGYFLVTYIGSKRIIRSK